MIKTVSQGIPFSVFAYLAYSAMYIPSSAAFAAFLLSRYYSPMRYPFLNKFESYYVRSIELSADLEKVKMTYVMVKQQQAV